MAGSTREAAKAVPRTQFSHRFSGWATQKVVITASNRAWGTTSLQPIRQDSKPPLPVVVVRLLMSRKVTSATLSFEQEVMFSSRTDDDDAEKLVSRQHSGTCVGGHIGT